MERAAVDAAAARPPEHKRRGRAPTVMRLGHHVDDLVEGAADEIHELEFGDRTHSRERRAKSSANNGRFGDWRVNHPLRAKVMDKPVCDFEGTAVDANVLTNAED